MVALTMTAKNDDYVFVHTLSRGEFREIILTKQDTTICKHSNRSDENINIMSKQK